MAALATLDDLEAHRQRPFATGPEAEAAELALEAASEVVQAITHQHLTLVEDDVVLLLSRGTTFLLPELPVVEVSAVKSDGADVDFVALNGYGIVRVTGTIVDGMVEVTYTHGYADDAMPFGIIAATCRVAGAFLENPTLLRQESVLSYSRTFPDDVVAAVRPALARHRFLGGP